MPMIEPAASARNLTPNSTALPSPLSTVAGVFEEFQMLLVVACAADEKFAVAFAPLTVTAWFAGVNVKPVLVGVTV
jgi:hypothetical protein